MCLYEAITGEHPFVADHALVSMRRVAAGSYPPPAGAPPFLADLVRRSLDVDQARRLQDAGRFADALDLWLTTRRSAARPASLGGVAACGLAALVGVFSNTQLNE